MPACKHVKFVNANTEMVSGFTKKSAKYGKCPIISPGLTFVQKAFLLGLFSGKPIFGGAYYWKDFCVSKWVALDNINSLIHQENSLKQLIVSVHGLYSGELIIGRIFVSEVWEGLFSGGLIFGGGAYYRNFTVVERRERMASETSLPNLLALSSRPGTILCAPPPPPPPPAPYPNPECSGSLAVVGRRQELWGNGYFFYRRNPTVQIDRFFFSDFRHSLNWRFSYLEPPEKRQA